MVLDTFEGPDINLSTDQYLGTKLEKSNNLLSIEHVGCLDFKGWVWYVLLPTQENEFFLHGATTNGFKKASKVSIKLKEFKEKMKISL